MASDPFEPLPKPHTPVDEDAVLNWNGMPNYWAAEQRCKGCPKSFTKPYSQWLSCAAKRYAAGHKLTDHGLRKCSGRWPSIVEMIDCPLGRKLPTKRRSH